MENDKQHKYKTCGECPDCVKHPQGGYLCRPIKDKYGAEDVKRNQSPSVNCHQIKERKSKWAKKN